MGLLSKSTADYSKVYAEYGRGKNAYIDEQRGTANIGKKAYAEQSALLGLSGDRDAALERFRDTPGLQFAQDEAARSTSRQMGAAGYSSSGNVLAALQERSQGLADQQFNTYLGQLGTHAAPGLGASKGIADMEWNYSQAMASVLGQEAKDDAEASNYKKQMTMNAIMAAAGGAMGGMGALGGAGGMSGAMGGMQLGQGTSNSLQGGGGGGMDMQAIMALIGG